MALDFSWQDGDRVMFLGDMLTEDITGYTKLVPAMVSARYPDRVIDYIPRGVGGNRVGDLLERIDRDVFGNDPLPNWITVNIGINDVWHGATGTPLGRFRELYQSLIMRLGAAKANLICLTTTVIGEELDNEQNKALVGYNDAIKEIAFANGAQVVDINAAFLEAIGQAQSRNPDFRFTTNGANLNTYGNYLFALTLLRGMNFAV